MRVAESLTRENPLIRADIIEATEFPEWAEKFNVYGVPKVVINGESEFEGSLPEKPYMDAILKTIA